MPLVKSIRDGYTGTYDAWNRLAKIDHSHTELVSQYEYDGLHRRIVRHEDTDDDSLLEANGDDDLRHFYYNEKWQCLVEAVDSGSGPVGDTLYSYHPQYIDAVATRMRASDGHYYCHDANLNVTALMSINESAKPVVERYSYTPYGEVTVLNGNATYDPDGSTYAEWSADPDNQSDIDNE